MLNYSSSSFSASPTRVVSGQFLAKNKLSARERAKLAADLCAGKATITGLTMKQAARLCRVCTPYVVEARAARQRRSASCAKTRSRKIAAREAAERRERSAHRCKLKKSHRHRRGRWDCAKCADEKGVLLWTCLSITEPPF